MAMPKEDGDGVGPKGEGALRAPLGEPEAWMFPAHIRTTHTRTHIKGLIRLMMPSTLYTHSLHVHTS